MRIARLMLLGTFLIPLTLLCGGAEATCITLFFQGDVDVIEDYNYGSRPNATYLETHEDVTIELVLDLGDTFYRLAGEYGGLRYDYIEGYGSPESIVWRLSDGSVLLEQTREDLLANYTWDTFVDAIFDYSYLEDLSTGDIDFFFSVDAHMNGFENTGGENYERSFMRLSGDSGPGSSETQVEAEWGIGEWWYNSYAWYGLPDASERLPLPEMELNGEGMRYQFTGEIVPIPFPMPDGVVPEPASLTLLGLGLAALAARRTRMRRK